jgi:hypothetical protein
VLLLAFVLWVDPHWAFCAGDSEIDAPFSTIEDGRQYQRMIAKRDFAWLYQKPFIAGIVEKVLIARGFEKRTARALAEEWDGIRYDIETGAKIMEKRPINMTAKDAGRYAARIPDCLSDFPNSNCELNYASELGCKLDPTVKEVCQRNFRFEQAVFSGPRGLTLYPALSCVFEGEKGADLVVFKPKELAAATKLKFDGVADSAKFEIAQGAVPEKGPKPARTAIPCQDMLKATHRLPPNDYGENVAMLFLRDVRKEITQFVRDVAVAVRTNSALSPLKEGAAGLGLELHENPKASIVLPPEAEMRTIIDDFRVAWIGAHVTGDDEKNTQDPTIDNRPPVITEVSADGPAVAAGISLGDKILQIGEEEVSYSNHFDNLIRDLPIGVSVEVVVQNPDGKRVIEVVPIAMEESAAGGDALAMRLLGRYYFAGLGFSQADNSLARQWYEKAAAAGDTRAMIALARLYFGTQFGPTKDIPRNEELGRQWLQRAIARGDPDAMTSLAHRHWDGIGGTRNAAEARRLIGLAAEAGSPRAMVDLGFMYQNGEGGSPDLGQARSWYERAASNGHPIGMRNLGVLYANGIGVPKNTAIARKWYQRALDAGDPNAARYLEQLR